MANFMEEVIVKLTKKPLQGAYILRLGDMVTEMAEFKYADLFYNPKYDNPWCHVRAGEAITLWIIPK